MEEAARERARKERTRLLFSRRTFPYLAESMDSPPGAPRPAAEPTRAGPTAQTARKRRPTPPAAAGDPAPNHDLIQPACVPCGALSEGVLGSDRPPKPWRTERRSDCNLFLPYVL